MKINHSRRLSLEERKKIEELLHQNTSHKNICCVVGIATTTLYREFKKCSGPYNAEEAHNNTYRPYKLIDWEIIGKKYGLLTVLAYANKYNHRTWWKCKCDCGKICFISRKKLADYCSPKRPLSCGCIAKQWAGKEKQLPMEEAALRKFQDMMKFRKINGECWEWTGYRQKGVPKTSWKNKSMSVRKCMYLLINGTTYEPNPVFTTCANLSCFNPEHITLQRPPKRHFYIDKEE